MIIGHLRARSLALQVNCCQPVFYSHVQSDYKDHPAECYFWFKYINRGFLFSYERIQYYEGKTGEKSFSFRPLNKYGICDTKSIDPGFL